jgi:hypothetical protein
MENKSLLNGSLLSNGSSPRQILWPPEINR